jgi:hypothetical protein
MLFTRLKPLQSTRSIKENNQSHKAGFRLLDLLVVIRRMQHNQLASCKVAGISMQRVDALILWGNDLCLSSNYCLLVFAKLVKLGVWLFPFGAISQTCIISVTNRALFYLKLSVVPLIYISLLQCIDCL